MRLGLGFILLSFGASLPAFAGPIPYPNSGTIAPEVLTYAATSGGVNVYFDGSGAAFTDYVRVVDVNTGYNSGNILDNHGTPLGTEVTVGTDTGQINAGDQLVFYIDSPQGLFASVGSDSADGVNHAYITSYAGGTIGSSTVGAGLYVGLEDETLYESDFNYHDDTFIFTGVEAPSVNVTPEPNSLVLLSTGVLGMAGVLRRRFAR